jgi:hypothetical protein
MKKARQVRIPLEMPGVFGLPDEDSNLEPMGEVEN